MNVNQLTPCNSQLKQRRIQNPAKHLTWSLLQKKVNSLSPLTVFHLRCLKGF